MGTLGERLPAAIARMERAAASEKFHKLNEEVRADLMALLVAAKERAELAREVERLQHVVGDVHDPLGALAEARQYMMDSLGLKWDGRNAEATKYGNTTWSYVRSMCDTVAALRALLRDGCMAVDGLRSCSLPHDVSGQHMVERASAWVGKARAALGAGKEPQP